MTTYLYPIDIIHGVLIRFYFSVYMTNQSFARLLGTCSSWKRVNKLSVPIKLQSLKCCFNPWVYLYIITVFAFICQTLWFVYFILNNFFHFSVFAFTFFGVFLFDIWFDFRSFCFRYLWLCMFLLFWQIDHYKSSSIFLSIYSFLFSFAGLFSISLHFLFGVFEAHFDHQLHFCF